MAQAKHLPTTRLIVAITGASGAIYAIRLLRAALIQSIRIDLIVSDYGKRLLLEECELNLKTAKLQPWLQERYGDALDGGSVTLHNSHDLGAEIASGSQQWHGMVVVPCSMKTLSSIAAGSSASLIERCADVTLKEGRRLVVVPRETPLNLIQLENMARVARAGGQILPAMPAFYQQPRSIDDLADFIAGRILSLLKIPHTLFEPWAG